MVPDRVTAVLIGDLDLVQVRRWAEIYFGDWQSSSEGSRPPDVKPRVQAQPVTFDRSCACSTRVELRFPSVPFSHPDALPLDLLAAVLAGRSGPLNRELVLAPPGGEDETTGAAFSAVATHTPLRRAGTFAIEVEGREGADAETLERRLRALIDDLRDNGFTTREVERGRNQLTTSTARQVKAPLSLALRLGVYDVLGDWRRVYDLPKAVQEISEEQLEDALRTYLDPKRASVLRLQRAPGGRQ